MYRDGLLYESTGSTTSSTLRCLDPSGGSVLKSVTIDDDYAEGIAAVENRIFQLSWKSGIARVFRFPELVQVDAVRYEGEGWGLAAWRHGLIMSNGTCRLQFRDSHFRTTAQLAVHSHRLPLRLINDLEYVDGFIYANVLYSSHIWIIGAETGNVAGIIDCSGLVEAAAPTGDGCVLNGIAYNHDRGTFFLTGKNWACLFEVILPSAYSVDSCADTSSIVANNSSTRLGEVNTVK
jgi:glutamine cyclotransferase